VKAALERRRRHGVVRRRWDDDAHGVNPVEQRIEGVERLHAELVAHLRRALDIRFVETNQLRTEHVAENPRVVKPQRARADDSDAHGHQITEPRSLRSKNARNSSISGYAWSSAVARSRACDRFSSDLKNRRYARFNSRRTSSGKPFLSNPTTFR